MEIVLKELKEEITGGTTLYSGITSNDEIFMARLRNGSMRIELSGKTIFLEFLNHLDSDCEFSDFISEALKKGITVHKQKTNCKEKIKEWELWLSTWKSETVMVTFSKDMKTPLKTYTKGSSYRTKVEMAYMLWMKDMISLPLDE